MKEKIFQLLKQEYKSLGLGDEVLQAHAEMLDKMGLVTDDNIETVVASQKDFLESLQKDNDRRVTDAKKKFEEAQKAKEDAERKAAEEEAKKKAEEAERKRLEELAKKNEMPDYLKKYFEEQAAEKKASEEARTKEREEFKKLVETLTQKNTDQAKTYNEQMETQSKTIKELQETIQKQAEEAKAKEEAAAKAKAKADHDAKILSKAKELGIPESRINEGFTLSDDATDEAIETYLSKVANNYKALQQPQFGGSYRASEGEPTKEDVDNVAASLVQSL
ncbi:hypothetical protein [Segatella copri]|uniref:hypothetical protein n=1 Tax=Segatella copri TaxID=165179 RepID=UPI0022DF9B19|nr:hypothetical protein [Segatella copri]